MAASSMRGWWGWLGTLGNGYLQLVLPESLWWGYAIIIGKGEVELHHFPQLQDATSQKAWLAPGVGGLDFSAQNWRAHA